MDIKKQIYVYQVVVIILIRVSEADPRNGTDKADGYPDNQFKKRISKLMIGMQLIQMNPEVKILTKRIRATVSKCNGGGASSEFVCGRNAKRIRVGEEVKAVPGEE